MKFGNGESEGYKVRKQLEPEDLITSTDNNELHRVALRHDNHDKARQQKSAVK